MAQVEQDFERSIDALERIFKFAETFLSEQRIDDRHRFSVNFALEELFTNIIKYSRGGGNDVRIALDHANGALTIRLTDFDVEPFDVTASPDADVDAPLAERTPGGLGLHLTRRLMDTIDYRYEDRTSTVTMTKDLKSVED